MIEIEQIVILTYFTIKNYFYYVKLKFFADVKLPIILTILVSVLSLIVTNAISNEYQGKLTIGFMKGSLDLPPYYLLLISADIITSVFLYLSFRKLPKDKQLKFAFELIRLFFLYFIFGTLLTRFWLTASGKKIDLLDDYRCTQSTLIVDITNYYVETGRLPQNLSLASTINKNPVNNSELFTNNSDEISQYKVLDTEGNVFIDGTTDLMGFSNNKELTESTLKNMLTIKDIACD